MELVFEACDPGGSALSAEKHSFLGLKYDDACQLVYLNTDSRDSLYVLPMTGADYETFAKEIFGFASRALMLPCFAVGISGGPVFKIRKNQASSVSLKDKKPCKYTLKRVSEPSDAE